MSKYPLFERRHYIEIAKLLHEIGDEITREKVTKHFIDLFTRNNINFNAERFRNAVITGENSFKRKSRS